MATVKKTLSLDADAWAFAERAAEAVGLSPSAWLSRAARQQAIRQAYQGGTVMTEAEATALADEAETGAAQEELRAAG
jgi:hypothetical protein